MSPEVNPNGEGPRFKIGPMLLGIAWMAILALVIAAVYMGVSQFESEAIVRRAFLQYLYGVGWLVICVACSIGAYRVFDWLDPLDFRDELRKGNMAVGLVIGLMLLGMTLGTLIFAGMIS